MALSAAHNECSAVSSLTAACRTFTRFDAEASDATVVDQSSADKESGRAEGRTSANRGSTFLRRPFVLRPQQNNPSLHKMSFAAATGRAICSFLYDRMLQVAMARQCRSKYQSRTGGSCPVLLCSDTAKRVVRRNAENDRHAMRS